MTDGGPTMTRLHQLCAICKTPIRLSKRGWEHVKQRAKFGGHKPVLLENETERVSQEIRG